MLVLERAWGFESLRPHSPLVLGGPAVVLLGLAVTTSATTGRGAGRDGSLHVGVDLADELDRAALGSGEPALGPGSGVGFDVEADVLRRHRVRSFAVVLERDGDFGARFHLDL